MRLPEVRIVANTKSPESTLLPVEASGEILEGGLKIIQTARKEELGENTAREFVNMAARVEARLEEAKVAEFLRS